jgi:hypothetical protein
VPASGFVLEHFSADLNRDEIPKGLEFCFTMLAGQEASMGCRKPVPTIFASEL